MKSNKKHQKNRIICIVVLFLLGTSCLYGQSYNQIQLMNKEWVWHQEGKAFHYVSFFTSKEIITHMFMDGVKVEAETKNYYYLSDHIVDTFHPDSVEKSKSGKYIVVLSKGFYEERLELYEILELTETTFKEKHLRSGSVLEYKVK